MKKLLSYGLHYACRPSALAESPHGDNWYFYLAAPGLCTMLFFLQIGLDKLAVQFSEGVHVFAFAALGLISGAVFGLLLAALVWGGVKLFGKAEFNLALYFKLVPPVCAAFGLPACVMLVGLLGHLCFGWSTGLSFGLVAMLCVPVLLVDVFRSFWKDSVWIQTAAMTVIGGLLATYLHTVMTII